MLVQRLVGALSITVPVDAGSLGSRVNTIGGGTISGPLGQVQVNDARSAAPLTAGRGSSPPSTTPAAGPST